MISLPNISLVTCSFQQGQFLDSTIRSVLDQNYRRLEYIVMDGGSNDGSESIIRKYEEHLAHWVSKKDAGQTDALARGFDHSSGEIMGWLCSDDLLLPNALNVVGDFFARNATVDIVYGDAVWIDEWGSPLRTKKEMPFNRFVFLFDHNFLPQPSVFWRRSLYERVGGLDRRFDLAMDTDLWERFSRIAHIRHLPLYLSGIRSYAAQKTQALRLRSRAEDATIRKRSRLGLNDRLSGAMRPLARAIRVATRFGLGCYQTQVPAELVEALRQYEIVTATSPEHARVSRR